MSRLRSIGSTAGSGTPMVLHGTHGVGIDLLKKAIACGVHKVNQIKTVRCNYGDFLADNAGKMELSKLHESAVEIYADEVAEMMDVLGSSNRS